jgi:hypothetical protein
LVSWTRYESPGASVPELNVAPLSSEVAVCETVPLFVQQTKSPGLMETSA